QLFDRAVDAGYELGPERARLADHAVQQGVEVLGVGLAEAMSLTDIGFDDAGILIREQPLIQALQRELARAMARRAVLAGIRVGGLDVHGSSSVAMASSSSAIARLAISTATRAASVPFSCMRSRAWSSSSVVRTALAIGMPRSRPIRVMPAPDSFATRSK